MSQVSMIYTCAIVAIKLSLCLSQTVVQFENFSFCEDKALNWPGVLDNWNLLDIESTEKGSPACAPRIAMQTSATIIVAPLMVSGDRALTHF